MLDTSGMKDLAWTADDPKHVRSILTIVSAFEWWLHLTQRPQEFKYHGDSVRKQLLLHSLSRRYRTKSIVVE